MDAAYRSTQSPYSGASPTQLVAGNFAEPFANKAVEAHKKDQVLAAALSEYCRLKEDGTVPQVDEFCRRFPTYHKSIQRMIDVEETLDKLGDDDDTEWPEVGSSFMGFDVLHELGVGAFARVYLAAEPALGGRLVAVKVAMFGSDEAETLGKLVHPNVVPVHSVRDDPESGMTAVCMPYLGSATLSDIIEQVFQDGVPQHGSTILQAVACREVVGKSATGPSDHEADKSLCRGSYVDAVVRLGIQMAEALVYTHAQGVLHRDLKPSNVLITPSGQPKLLDFNLSCDVELEVNRLGGTLPYMPPEQINDVFLRPFDAQPPTDPRSDIFSLGVILYELLTGQLPFGNPPSNMPPVEAGAIYLEAQQSPPRPIQELNPAIESSTARLIESCIAPNPDCRPLDAATAVAELASHFSLPRTLRRKSAENKKTLIGAAIVLCTILGLFAQHLATRPSLDRRLYNAGLEAMNRKDYYEAIDYFAKALPLNLDEPAIRVARGLCYQALDEGEFAQSDFYEVAGRGECEPIVEEVYAYSSLLQSQSKLRIAATIPYGNLSALNPDDIQMKVNQAFANYYMVAHGRPPGDAKRLAKEILKLHPTNHAALHILALCKYHYFTHHQYGSLAEVLEAHDAALAVGSSGPHLEIDRLRVLASMAKNDPQRRDGFISEMKSRLEVLLPHINREMLNRNDFALIADEPWFIAAKERCPIRAVPTRQSFIVKPPSEKLVQEYLERTWQ